MYANMIFEFLVPMIITYIVGFISLIIGVVVAFISPTIWYLDPALLMSCGIFILSITLPSYYYPDRRCNTCDMPLLLPLGADHILCAARHHPYLALLGWGYWLLGHLYPYAGAMEAILKIRIRREAIRKGLRNQERR